MTKPISPMSSEPRDPDDVDTDYEPTISVHELRSWFVKYALRHEGTERERIADEIASFIDTERESVGAGEPPSQ